MLYSILNTYKNVSLLNLCNVRHVIFFAASKEKNVVKISWKQRGMKYHIGLLMEWEKQNNCMLHIPRYCWQNNYARNYLWIKNMYLLRLHSWYVYYKMFRIAEWKYWFINNHRKSMEYFSLFVLFFSLQ